MDLKKEKVKEINLIRDINKEKIEVIFNEENLGIATALNIGVKEGLRQGYNWILTMDQDSKCSKDIVEKMFEVYNGIEEKREKRHIKYFP